MYRKPLILENEDLAESVFAASGASKITFTRLSTSKEWPGGGYVHFEASIPTEYQGKHIKIVAKLAPADATKGVTELENENWQCPATLELFGQRSDAYSVEVESYSITVIK